MTKKHFEIIAAALKLEADHARQFPGDEHRNGAAVDHLENLAMRLAYTFQALNPRFDRAKFLSASGF